MKVLFHLYIGFDTDGPSVHLLTDIVEQCLIAGHDVYMIVRNRGGKDSDIPARLAKYNNLHCDVIYSEKLNRSALVTRYVSDIKYAFKCQKIYKKYMDIDVVFLQSCTAPIFPIILLKKALHKPILFNVQNIFPIDALAIHKLSKTGLKGGAFYLLRMMQQRAYKLADKIVTISEDMKVTLVKEKVDEGKIAVIHNWGYMDNPKVIEDKDNLFLKTHPELKKYFRVVFSGNMGAQVNADLIANAAEHLQEINKIQFIIIGDGGNMEYLKKVAKEKKLTNMRFYPYQPLEFALHNYAMAHVGINALPKGIVYTCMPSKTAQMLSMARPMVSSMELDSWLARVLSTVDKSIVVDVDDDKGFADAILKIFYSKNYENSENARSVASSLCSRENAKRYVFELEKLAQKS